MVGPRADAPPLVVDLDGTLVLDDTMLLQLRRAIGQPATLRAFTERARQSRAMAKCFLWDAVGLDAATLRYSPRLLALLRWEQANGRHLILATGAPHPLAQAVSEHLGLFDDFVGSSPEHNLTAARKAEWVVTRCGRKGFDYAGNASADVPIWRESRGAIVCNASRAVRRAARRVAPVITELDDRWYRGPGLQQLMSTLVP